MPLKTFFQIKEANAEISRLSTELTNAQTALTEAQTAATAVLEAKDKEHTAAISAKDAKITELTGTISTLTVDRDAARADVTAKAEKITELEGKSTTVEQRAAEIAAGIGGKQPVAAGDPAKSGEANDPRAKMQQAWSRDFIRR